MMYAYDRVSLVRDGKRWFPIMGEIHYSRVPRAFWEDELCKMKAGGVDVVSAYTIWIHHEEVEGVYDWSGDRDLRSFVASAKKCGLKVLLRIGPWCHGEVRNGGFPDWLLGKPFEPRTNDEGYFSVVGKWYSEVFRQVEGFVCSGLDDGSGDEPIIGVQIENEYGHCGGLYEREGGEEHMRRLRDLAEKCGFVVPIYTATGWGGAWTGGMVPVMGGYCDAPWDQRLTEIEPSGNYTFTYERNDHNIGSDHGFGYGITFDMEKFPYLTAELGGGLQVTKHRRTVATAKDIAAVATVKMGSGVNLLGFYMYHGGTNPEGKLSTLQESKATGSLNDLPVKSYDFRAPVREFGQVSQTLRELKLLSYFALDFGSGFCDLPASIPSDNPLDPKDTESLRYSFRTDGKRGYLFVNNYVRHRALSNHNGVSIKAPSGVVFPKMDIGDGEFFFFPFGVQFGDAEVRTATATPLLRLDSSPGKNARPIFVFYKREGDSSSSGFLDFANGKKPSDFEGDFLVLSRKDALNLWRVKGRLFVTGDDACVMEDSGGGTVIFGRKEKRFLVYPDFGTAPDGWERTGFVDKQADSDLGSVMFAVYERDGDIDGAQSFPKKLGFENLGGGAYRFDVSHLLDSLGKADSVSDVFLKVSYKGESAEIRADVAGERKLILDDFYLGDGFDWEIGLKRFLEKNSGTNGNPGKVGTVWDFSVNPLQKNPPIYFERLPEFSSDSIAVLESIDVETEWRFKI